MAADYETKQAIKTLWDSDPILTGAFGPLRSGRLKAAKPGEADPTNYAWLDCKKSRDPTYEAQVAPGKAYIDYRLVTVKGYGDEAAMNQMADQLRTWNGIGFGRLDKTLTYATPSTAICMAMLLHGDPALIEDETSKKGKDVWQCVAEFEVTSTRTNPLPATPLPPPFPPPPTFALITTGLLAEYRFDEGQGTTLTAYDANGNVASIYNGVLGNNLGAGFIPAWVPQGLQFQDTSRLIAFPQALLNSAVSICVVFQGQGVSTGFRSLMGGGSGQLSCGLGNQDNRLWIGGNGTPTQTQTAEVVDGTNYHFATFVLDNSQDLIFLNNHTPIMLTRGPGNTLTKGTQPYWGWWSGFLGLANNNVMGYALVYNRALSFTDHQQNFLFVQDRMARRAAQLGDYNTVKTTGPQTVWDGNSLPAGSGTSTIAGQLPRQTLALLSGTYQLVNVAIGGSYIGSPSNDPLVRAPGGVDQLYNAAKSKNALVFWELHNAILQGRTAAQVYADEKTYGSGRKTAGYSVIHLDCLPSTAFSAANNTTKNSVNASLAGDFTVATSDPLVWGAGPGVTYGDYLVQASGIANLSDPTNVTYYADGTHLTNAGYALVAAKVKIALNALGIT